MTSNKLIFAVPKGRILGEVLPLFEKCDIRPEPAFFDPQSRLIRFQTNHEALDIILVRAFDVATFTAFGAAHLGLIGSDVIEEFHFDELYAPVNLKIGRCRLSLAAPESHAIKMQSLNQESHIKVTTKYPYSTARYFAARGIQAECIKLNGAMEIAPALGLSDYIVDLVSSGATLKENGLKEICTIADVTTHLAVNRTALKTMPEAIGGWIRRFREAV